MRKFFVLLAMATLVLTVSAQNKSTGVRKSVRTQRSVAGKSTAEKKAAAPSITAEEVLAKVLTLVADTTGFKTEATLRSGDKTESFLVSVKNGKVYCDIPADKSESWFQKDVIYMHVKDTSKEVQSIFIFKDDGSGYYKYNPFVLLDGDYSVTMTENNSHYELTVKDRGETSDAQYFKIIVDMKDFHPIYFVIKNEENVATYHFINFLSGIADKEVTFDKSQFEDAHFVDNRQL